MEAEPNWIEGDPKLARIVWLRRRGHWLIVMITVGSFTMAIVGFLSPFVGTHGGELTFWGWVLFAMIPISSIALTILYLYHRLKGRPAELLAVPTGDWHAQPLAHPDTTDSDGDPVKSDIKYLLFTPDVTRTITLPARQGTDTGTCTFIINHGWARFAGESNTAPVKQPEEGNRRMVWLEPGLTYDDDSKALTVSA